ncbi:hypothetical protein B0H21DRAFT_686210 [Amylocystis lapponica]|nr:hypothetical protein B0H21DRAFT_686210 [Amylocystis lapponica]
MDVATNPSHTAPPPSPTAPNTAGPSTTNDQCSGTSAEPTEPAPNAAERNVSEPRTGGEKTTQRRAKSGLLHAAGLTLSLTLENTGSVARDHLASERTFLTYVRTSLAIAAAGVALVQLFTIAEAETADPALARVSRPLGATFVAVALIVLALGAVRYFTVQHALLRGVYPAARASAALVALALMVLILAVFVILLVVRGTRGA